MLQVLIAISQKFVAEKRRAMQKLFIKKREEERRIEKMDKCSKY